MNPYNNLPPQQRRIQWLVSRFNGDEQLWQSLEPRRRARRQAWPILSSRHHKALDLLEFAQARPPQDCIGEEIWP